MLYVVIICSPTHLSPTQADAEAAAAAVAAAALDSQVNTTQPAVVAFSTPEGGIPHGLLGSFLDGLLPLLQEETEETTEAAKRRLTF